MIKYCLLAMCQLLTGEPVLLTDPPSNFSMKAEVASVIPFIDDKILLVQRPLSHPQANLWCAPGGKMNPTETPLLTAKRELQEETGIEADLSSLHYLGKFYVRYPNGDFIFHLFQTFVEKDFKGVILSDEHEAYGLYTPEELRSLPLTPGLDECINLALQNQP